MPCGKWFLSILHLSNITSTFWCLLPIIPTRTIAFSTWSLLTTCSGRFGTFLCNSEKERVQLDVHKRTNSVWSYVNSKPEQFINPLYKPNQKILLPLSSTFNLAVWRQYYCRWREDQLHLESIEGRLLELCPQAKTVNVKAFQTNLKQFISSVGH